jgi:hypothetical protein
VLVFAIASVTVLACTKVIDAAATVLLLAAIAGAAGAFVGGRKGNPGGGAAVALVLGLGALGAEAYSRFRGA